MTHLSITSLLPPPCFFVTADSVEEEEDVSARRDSTGRVIPKEVPHSWRLTSKNAKIIKDVQSSAGK